jgi:hypothetical protein
MPREFEGSDIDVKLVNKTKEEYEEPAYTAFSGGGATLGGSAPQDAAVMTRFGASLVSRATELCLLIAPGFTAMIPVCSNSSSTRAPRQR